MARRQDTQMPKCVFGEQNLYHPTGETVKCPTKQPNS